MLKLIAALTLLPAALSLPSYNRISLEDAKNALCEIKAEGEHPALDLNNAKFSEDQKVDSKGHPDVEFAVQVCEGLSFSDKVCGEGATVCRINKTKQEGIAVYGYTDTITTAWEEKYLVMTLAGGLCAANSDLHTQTKIFFSCGETKSFTLKDDSSYGCFVEFNYTTPVACGGSTPGDKYTCHENKCVPSESGVDKETCESICETTEKKYKCSVPDPSSEPVCMEDSEGTYASKSDCETNCKRTYVCRSGECTAVLDGTGGSLDYCKRECDEPAEDKYVCTKGTCEKSTTGGVSKETCETICGSTGGDKYTCHENKCVEDSKGVPKETCEQICETGGDKKYVCKDAHCVEDASGKGIDLESCKTICETAVPGFMQV